MKKLFAIQFLRGIILTVFVLLHSNIEAQITKLKVEDKNQDIVLKYDSLTNINIENAHRHIGQTIYLREDKLSQEWGGYHLIQMYTKPTFEYRNDFLYKSVPKKEQSYANTCDYEQLKAKYFYVNDCIKQEKKASDIFKPYSCLELIETTSKDTVYLAFKDTKNPFDYFITVGYIDKLKQLYCGQEYYYLGEEHSVLNEYRGVRNLLSGEKSNTPIMSKLKCIDISIKDGGNNEIIAILTDSSDTKMYVKVNDVIYSSPNNLRILQPIAEHEANKIKESNIIKKYGVRNGKLINEGKVELGFTKQMCIESWGEPTDINVSTGSYGSHEQWVYDGNRYLYFENGKLTSFQN